MHRPLFEHAARDIRQDGHPQSYRVRDIDEERFEDYPLEFILLGMESSDMDALVRQFSSVYYYTITYYYETSLFIYKDVVIQTAFDPHIFLFLFLWHTVYLQVRKREANTKTFNNQMEFLKQCRGRSMATHNTRRRTNDR